MIFNPGASKQAQEVMFDQKIKKKTSSSSDFQQCYCVSNLTHKSTLELP